MDLAQISGKKTERPFEGDDIRIEAIVDRPIEILDFTVRPGDKKPDTPYLKMQVRFEGKRRLAGGGCQFLCEALRQTDNSNLPFSTIIRDKRGYYSEGTTDEE